MNNQAAKILLAEDDDFLRGMMTMILQGVGYEVRAVEDGSLALACFEEYAPDLVVSDISMPQMNGYALLKAIRELPLGTAVPFLFTSAHTERSDVTRARRMGVDDYLFKPFEPEELLEAVEVRLARRRAVLISDTHEAHIQTVCMLANVIEARDAYTRGHVERVCAYARAMGRALAWDADRMIILEYGAILHDIGKIIVPSEMLNKKDAFTEQEWAIMRRHSRAGAHMLRGVTHLQAAIPYVLHHHEKWDGSGYPEGLCRDAIPLEGRLMAIVDVFDAMTTERPYHIAVPPAEALESIRAGSGQAFDPYLVSAFLEIADGLPEIPQ